MGFDGTTCSGTLSSLSVTGRFLKKVTSLTETRRREHEGRAGEGGGEVMGLEQEVKRHQTEANATTSHLPYAVTQIIKICGWSFTFNTIVLS